jgi:hypothetical protein
VQGSRGLIFASRLKISEFLLASVKRSLLIFS